MNYNTNKPDAVTLTDFLTEAKALIRSNDFIFVRRSVNLQCLEDYGLILKDVKQTILDLSSEDYASGPEADRDTARNGFVWIFHTYVEGDRFYIKLKIERRGRSNKLKCLSFHKG